MINSDFALAIHSLLLLASAGDELLTSSAISKKLNVHAVRVRKVLSKMKAEGFIESKEGAGGGFSVSCNMDKVTLKDIYRIMQEDLHKPKCHECCPSCKVGSNLETVLDSILEGADAKFQSYLSGYSLKQVMKMM